MKNPIDTFNEAIHLNPEDPDLYFDRGCYYFEDEQLELARADFLKAISLDKDFGDAYHQLAIMADMEDDTEQALAYMKKAVEVDEEDVISWFALGTLYAFDHQYEPALMALAKVLRLEADMGESSTEWDEMDCFSHDAYTLRTKIYIDLDQDEAAVAEAAAALIFNSQMNECQMFRALALLRLDRREEAQTLLNEILEHGIITRDELAEHKKLHLLVELL